MNICLIQPDLVWENKSQNLTRYHRWFDQIQKPTDLIILPEMFSTGFTMNAREHAEDMNGPTLAWMQQKAREMDCLLAGSLIIKGKNSYYNRFVAVSEQGVVATYDKRHLFRMGNEESHYTPGNQRVVFTYKGWRMLPQICYDLRFPVWMRNQGDYDLVVMVASWPEPRRAVWTTLLRARAIENQVYVAAVNRVGMDNKGINHLGDSLIISPKGEILQDLGSIPGQAQTELSLQDLKDFREKFPVHLDQDSFQIIP